MFTLMCQVKTFNTYVTNDTKIIASEDLLSPVAAYTNIEDAEHWGQVLTSILKGKDIESTSFLIMELQVDEKPIFHDMYQAVVMEDMDAKDATMKALMDKGMIEQLVGEDGEFWYELTDYGRRMAKEAGIDSSKFPKKSMD